MVETLPFLNTYQIVEHRSSVEAFVWLGKYHGVDGHSQKINISLFLQFI